MKKTNNKYTVQNGCWNCKHVYGVETYNILIDNSTTIMYCALDTDNRLFDIINSLAISDMNEAIERTVEATGTCSKWEIDVIHKTCDLSEHVVEIEGKEKMIRNDSNQ